MSTPTSFESASAMCVLVQNVSEHGDHDSMKDMNPPSLHPTYNKLYHQHNYKKCLNQAGNIFYQTGGGGYWRNEFSIKVAGGGYGGVPRQGGLLPVGRTLRKEGGV